MEKLQAALKKARAQRETGGRTVVQDRSGTVAKPGINKKAGLWSALPEITLSGEALRHHRVETQPASEPATPLHIQRTKVL